MPISKKSLPRFLRRQADFDPELPSHGSISLTDAAYETLVELWILRTMLPLGAHKNMLFPTQIRDDEVFVAIGLGMICKQESDGEYDRTAAMKALSARHAEVEARVARIPSRRPLERNLGWLSRRLGLSNAEVAILRFMVFTQECEYLSTVLSRLGTMSLQSIQRVLAALLGLPEARVSEALSPDGALASCGLVTVDYNYRGEFGGKIELLSGISDHLFSVQSDPMLMLRERVVPGRQPKLEAADYPHITDDVKMLRRYLERSAGLEGINVLVYGPPGTGKTEFVRMFAREMGRKLYEVATQEADSSPLSGSRRLRAYRLAQQMLRKESDAIILFDEIEDVFREAPDEGETRRGRNAAGKKAWLNQTLESNPVPSFWLSNAIHVIDSAVIRRFDYVLHLKNPPRVVRAAILGRYFESIPVGEKWIEHLSRHESLAPAVVERAAKVAASLDDLPSADVERVATRIISGTLEAMSLPPIKKVTSFGSTRYRVECLNTDPPVQEVGQRLADFGQGRLCLYGPPGTGKTAFGRRLAETLDRRLIVKRASDLLGAFVGETEKQIAAMFEEAMEEKAVLLLDEADSFLQARDKAVRSWEITQVNEMLTQMEQFEGIFIASTNFMDSLDEATLRRFDLKVRFNWLAPAQIELLYLDLLQQLGVPSDERWVGLARQIPTVTPGDFANVLRQARLRSMHSAELVYDALVAESKAGTRQKAGQRIGF